MGLKSLHARQNSLSNTDRQLEILSNGIFENGELPRFIDRIDQKLSPKKLEILQINMGYMCNQVCAHCHVDAGPDRKEIMTRKTLQMCLDICKNHRISTLDLTGGAPEMNPHFRWFVEESSTHVDDLIVRSNLTILTANKTYKELPEFFAKHNVHVVSSLPFYSRNKTDRQRGDGVFDKSIKALQTLNALGYGQPNSKLQLDLVYNPAGAFLPGDQKELEADFKKALLEDFGIVFNKLYTITNMPISRFLDYLLATENYEDYMRELVLAYNPTALENVMCTNTLSVGWDGSLYDCDFNQMLNLKINGPIDHISGYKPEINKRSIRVSQHCYGCTAGAGSSCQGALNS
ncbi:MAG: arsenosugar biosynthesis radical SAM protein ArsS [Flavobacteriaceae bacterium]|nr:arsenosugar biosynthesis radical SAM protein ArsS [Flavobacteriaceae bacterium]